MAFWRALDDWRAQAGSLLGLTIVWGTHVALTKLGDPLGPLFDIVLWVVASGLKGLTLVVLGVVLGTVHKVIAGDARRSWIAFGVWWVGLSAVVLALAATRDQWANLISNEVSQYYAVHQSWEGLEDHRATWLSAWKAGHVLAAEVALAALLAALNALAGFRLGHRPFLAVLSAYSASALVLAAYLRLTPWTVWGVDLFHGDIFPGALLADGLIPVLAFDPYTTIAIPFYLVLFGCGTVLQRLFRPPTP